MLKIIKTSSNCDFKIKNALKADYQKKLSVLSSAGDPKMELFTWDYLLTGILSSWISNYESGQGRIQTIPLGAQIFHQVGCISGGQTRAQSARELRAKPEPRAKPET